MPKVRGRFMVIVPTNGGSFGVESDKAKSLTASEIVEALREYADFIEKHFTALPASLEEA